MIGRSIRPHCRHFSVERVENCEHAMFFCLLAGVAQLVEQLICNQQVAGSNPIASSSNAKQSSSAGKKARQVRVGSEAVKRIRL